ncbi:MAG: signal peptidase II [Planctomycetota bacterium]
MNRPTALLIYFLLVASILALDLWSKAAAFDFLGAEVVFDPVEQRPSLSHYTRYPVIEGFFDLEAVLNLGAFSGWFAGHRWLLLGVSLLWVIGSLGFLLCRPRHATWLVLALALTAGGALGNLYDRYFLGAVRDFLRFYLHIAGEDRTWPNFNVADSCICCGVGLILIREFFHARQVKSIQAAALRESLSANTTDIVPPQATAKAHSAETRGVE